MNKRAEEMNEMLAGRTPITPDDLPPFGARVTTTQGYIGEIVGWYSPSSLTNSSTARQRMALAIVIEAPGASPELPEGKRLFLGYIFESWIARSEPQRFPRFAQWLREVAVSSVVGESWKEQ